MEMLLQEQVSTQHYFDMIDYFHLKTKKQGKNLTQYVSFVFLKAVVGVDSNEENNFLASHMSLTKIYVVGGVMGNVFELGNVVGNSSEAVPLTSNHIVDHHELLQIREYFDNHFLYHCTCVVPFDNLGP
jgi:hypothetical protein